MKKTTMVLFLMVLTSLTSAHDEGHGPQISDAGKYGGLVAPGIKKADEKLGAKAALVHKAELARAGDGTIRVYLYDSQMKPMDMKDFDKKAEGTLAVKSKGKWKHTNFSLEQHGTLFIGKMPKSETKPYNIEITLKQNGTELLAAFENLD